MRIKDNEIYEIFFIITLKLKALDSLHIYTNIYDVKNIGPNIRTFYSLTRLYYVV